MRGNSDPPTAWLIPEQYRCKWNALPVPPGRPGVHRVPPDWPVSRLYSLLTWEQEWAGAFGPDWIIANAGSRATALGPDMPFTWHSHQDGVCQFSHADWWSFLRAETCFTLLITQVEYKALIKRPAAVRPPPPYFNAMLVRWKTQGRSDVQIGDALGVDVLGPAGNQLHGSSTHVETCPDFGFRR